MGMKKELKQKWVTALRSGEYKQTTGRLERIENGTLVGNCCLGVLCRVAGIIPKNEGGIVLFNGAEGILTSELTKTFGLENFDIHELMRMNDGMYTPQRSFSQIADYIEANL